MTRARFQNSYTYDVYGEAAVTGSLANEFDFAGQQTDGDTGLQYLRARYMDPETGVFLSREPLAVAPGWIGCTHEYAAGRPTNLIDDTGLFPVSGNDDPNLSRGKKKCVQLRDAVEQAIAAVVEHKLVIEGGGDNPLKSTGRHSRQSRISAYKRSIRSLKNSLADWRNLSWKCNDDNNPPGGGIDDATADELIREYPTKLAEYQDMFRSSTTDPDSPPIIPVIPIIPPVQWPPEWRPPELRPCQPGVEGCR
ncbi:MAG: RHS repeat-associated core domain-containing protein [Dehalococcoidia bacterium]